MNFTSLHFTSQNNTSLSENLTRDAESHLRLFSGKFQRMEAHDVYEWQGVNDRLAVTVDWTQSGESPEFEECQMQKAEWRSKCRAEVRSEAERRAEKRSLMKKAGFYLHSICLLPLFCQCRKLCELSPSVAIAYLPILAIASLQKGLLLIASSTITTPLKTVTQHQSVHNEGAAKFLARYHLLTYSLPQTPRRRPEMQRDTAFKGKICRYQVTVVLSQ
ncbi:hypothetical protein TcWFU_010173 [Taenia crassiceps]|uniref:DUF5727 domain-containing protein n=1 Tax=Taenia crassiceps TaxID=6207 RepID=A0ABR4Q3M7_9CEST